MDFRPLQGPGLLLDQIRPSDTATIFEHCQDPDIQRWTVVPSPYSQADAVEFVEQITPAGWASGEALNWALRTAGPDGPLVGACGLSHRPSGAWEIGYWIAASARGQGLAFRACQALIDFAFAPAPAGLGLEQLKWCCAVGNFGSRAVAEKLGFVIDDQIVSQGCGPCVANLDAWIGQLDRVVTR